MPDDQDARAALREALRERKATTAKGLTPKALKNLRMAAKLGCATGCCYKDCPYVPGYEGAEESGEWMQMECSNAECTADGQMHAGAPTMYPCVQVRVGMRMRVRRARGHGRAREPAHMHTHAHAHTHIRPRAHARVRPAAARPPARTHARPPTCTHARRHAPPAHMRACRVLSPPREVVPQPRTTPHTNLT